MTLTEYKIRAAEFRQHMEKPMEPFYTAHPAHWGKETYLPGGEKRSMKVVIPKDEEDLSHLNPAFSKKFSRLARRGQKRRMKK